jgi:DNA-binding LacI/PurR family transcriptional regulator
MSHIHQKRKRRPTSQDVAELAGVSRATVSAFLNRNRYVSPELSQKIQEAIAELNYTPDHLARALKLEDTKTIGLIIPVLSHFYTPLMRAINDIAHEYGYGFLLSSSEENAERERELLEILMAKRISGILLGPCSEENKDLLNEIQRSGTPIVQVNRKVEGLEADSVVSDNFKAAYMATEHLIQRGRRKIVLLGYDPTTLSNAQKKAGYDAALKDHNIKDNLTIVVKEHNRENITAALTEFLQSNYLYDGLICTTQGKTAIALHLLKESGVQIPEDVAVVGFDDTVWSSLLCTPLTVVSETTYRMGVEAINLLLNRMKNTNEVPPTHIVLESEFIIRQST